MATKAKNVPVVYFEDGQWLVRWKVFIFSFDTLGSAIWFAGTLTKKGTFLVKDF